MASVCFSTDPVCSCKPSRKNGLLLKGGESHQEREEGKETALWCFIHQRNDFPRIKTRSIWPLSGTTCPFPVLKTPALNNEPGGENTETVMTLGRLLWSDGRYSTMGLSHAVYRSGKVLDIFSDQTRFHLASFIQHICLTIVSYRAETMVRGPFEVYLTQTEQC